MKRLFKKYREVITYIIFGILTTLVSIVTYFILTHTILNLLNKIELQIANIISWIISVLFAYFTNKKYVFNSNDSIKNELPKFVGARLFSLFLDMIIMYIGVSVLNQNDMFIKIISQIIVIVTNYILSKLIVFNNKKNM